MTYSKCLEALEFGEPADEYHARAKHHLSSHQLADFRKCPLLYYYKRIGLIPDTDSTAYLVGRATHTRILEGQEKFEAEYAVGGPVNPKTGKVSGSNTKAFAEWVEEQGKPVLTYAQADLVQSMSAGVARCDAAVALLLIGSPEGVARTEYCKAQCQIRIDWFNPNRGIVDLKTCDDLTWFEADAMRFGYTHQMAFYRAVLRQATGVMCPVHIIAVEKKAPYRCGVWRVSDESLGLAETENVAAIGRLAKCKESDKWPTGYESVRTLDIIC